MKRGRKGEGVELRANDIRVRFTLNGKREYVVLDWRPTVANHKAAKRLVARVNAAIEAGTFHWADHFPEAAQAKAGGHETVRHYGDLWLQKKRGLAPATRSQYDNALKTWYERQLPRRKLKLGDMAVADVRHSDLSALVGSVEWPSARMHNNAMIPLRGLFDLWVRDDRRHRFDPTEGITNQRFQKGKPDPFTPEETERIIARAYKKYGVEIGAYFEFAFFTWLRPEEEIAILWEKVDVATRMVKIDVVRTFRGAEKNELKTYEERDIECSDRAWDALMRMKPLTFLKPHGHVFENPRTGKQWHDERSQRDHYLKPILKALGIRARRAYCTRHTGITLALMAGCDPAWVAQQAGHKTTKMIWEVYSKWIPGHDKNRERNKMSGRYVRLEEAA